MRWFLKNFYSQLGISNSLLQISEPKFYVTAIENSVFFAVWIEGVLVKCKSRKIEMKNTALDFTLQKVECYGIESILCDHCGRAHNNKWST